MSNKMLQKGNYLSGLRMIFKGLQYRFKWKIFGLKINLSKEYNYLLNSCKYVLSHTSNYKKECYFYIYIIIRERKQYDKALKYIKKAIDLDQLNFGYRRMIGNILLAQGNYEEARKNFQACHQQDSQYFFSLFYIGQTYFVQNDYQSASSYYKETIAQKKDILILINQIDALIRSEQYEECLQQCNLAINVDPTQIRPYLIKCTLLIRQKKLKEAYEQLLILKQIDQSQFWRVNYDLMIYDEYICIGNYLRDQKKYSQSIYYQFQSLKTNQVQELKLIGINISDLQGDELLDFKLKINKFLDSNPDSYEQMANYMMSYQQIAVSLLQLKLYQNYLYILNNLAQIIQIDQIQNSNSFELREKVITVFLLRFEMFNALRVKLKCNDEQQEKENKFEFNRQYIFSQTCQAYDEFIFYAINNNLEEINIDLLEGYFLFYTNKFKKAKDYFEQKIIQNQNDLDAHLMIGNIYQKLQIYNKSIDEFDYVILKDKTNNWAYIQKAYSFYCLGQNNQIFPLYKEACKYCPNDFQLIKCFAFYLYESQLFSQALVLFDILFDQYRNYDIQYLYFRYGIIFYLLNNKRNALNILKTCKQSFPEFIHQGRKYEKSQPLLALEFYTDLLTIFNDQERSFLQGRIKILTDLLHKHN